MKKNILFFAMSATLLMSSCSDFLDVQPEGDATTTTYFTNDLQAIDAVDALYERFHQEAVYGRELFWEQGAACDVVWGLLGMGINAAMIIFSKGVPQFMEYMGMANAAAIINGEFCQIGRAHV